MIRKARGFPTDSEIRKRIAMNVTNLLAVRGLSRRDLAKVTGDPVATVARIAQGKHTAQAGVVVRVADALGVSVDRLLWDTLGGPARPQPAARPKAGRATRKQPPR